MDARIVLFKRTNPNWRGSLHLISEAVMLMILALLTPVILQAQSNTSAQKWKSLQFLLGEWTGAGSGSPGQGVGDYSFLPDLDNQVLVRKNHARYPATKDRPAYSHNDLMVVYQEARQSMRAIFFDNEGHVIHYAVELSIDGDVATFLSDAAPSAPRFRLTYTRTSNETVAIKFETAPPGKPEVFSTYIEAAARRKQSPR